MLELIFYPVLIYRQQIEQLGGIEPSEKGAAAWAVTSKDRRITRTEKAQLLWVKTEVSLVTS